jgi:multidrug efflux pump subunit AcrB
MIKQISKSTIRERFNISRLAIQYSWLTLGFWLAVAVAGILAFSSLKYALFPDVTFPVVVVNASAQLHTALDTENNLTKLIETKVSEAKRIDLKGLDRIESLSYPGQSVVSLNFAVGTDLNESKNKVEKILKNIKLPEGSSYKVIPINLNEASVVTYVIESKSINNDSKNNYPNNLETLSKISKTEILPQISKIPGVLKANLLGEPLKFDITKLASAEQGLQGINIIRFNGKQVLALQVVKKGDANTLEVVKEVNRVVEQLEAKFKNIKFTLATTQADYIRGATGETIQALIEAIILSVVVIMPFLWNWKATIISAVAIPISLLGTFIVMAIYGFNLETLTLLALAMVIGSIIDDAIVDVENISRHLENGETPKQAAIFATNEIGLTVTAATLTAVAVFLPVGLMGGVIGQFFRPFGITVSAAMLISLLVARTLSPLLAAYWLKPKSEIIAKNKSQNKPLNKSPNKSYQIPNEASLIISPKQNWISKFVSNYQKWLLRINYQYRNLLNWSLGHRGIVISIALVSFIVGLALIPFIPKGFIPKLDRGEFNITYTSPLPEIVKELNGKFNNKSGEKVEKNNQLNNQPNNQSNNQSNNELAFDILVPGLTSDGQVIASLSDFNPFTDSLKVAEKLDEFVSQSPEVEKVLTTVGSRHGEPNKGTIYIKLKKNHSISTGDLQDQFRKNLPKMEGVSTSVEDIQFVDTGAEKPVQIKIIGEDLSILNKSAKEIKTRLEKIKGLEDISTTGELNQGNEIFEIKRINGQRIAVISANLGANLAIGEATDRAIAETKAVIPPGISLQLGGDSARVDEILGSFATTLGLSVICIILVIYLLFRSWIDTFVIFLSLPLSIVGAMLGLLIVQSDFGMISLIGIIFLLGLTNKNAILIVDYIKQLRKQGRTRQQAILEAAPVRLRPILMTTAATILGMLPLAIGLGPGAELRAPMAVAIMGGLVTSTLLSLIVVPVIYDLLDDLWGKK